MPKQILKIPRITKTSKLGKFFENPVVMSKSYQKFSLDTDRKKYKLNRNDYLEKINDLQTGNTNYLVSGVIKNNIVKQNATTKDNERYSSYKRKYSIAFKAKPNLTQRELASIVGNKLRIYYLEPKDGNSSNYIEGFSMNSFQLPDNYEFHRFVRMFELSHIESKMMCKYTIPIDIKYNCVVDYLYNEFQKINTEVNKEIIIKRLSEFCNIKQDGVSIEAFEKYMGKYHKKIRYSILSPNFDCISQYKPTYNYDLHLTFYVNNSHLYPIQDTNVQQYIANHLTQYKKYNFEKYFKSMEILKYNNSEYMEKYDPENEKEEITYIMNKDIDINDFCLELVDKTKYQPDYIDLNHKTGTIESFKHPTKEIIYQSYNDYHRRKKVCEHLNAKFDNEFINFNNQSYANIAKTLINHLDELPTSDYNEHTFDYLNKYEPKPIVDILKSHNLDYVKDNILQIDYYKQYSSIFYTDFERFKIKIPIYDIFNTVEEYKLEEIEIGEYFIKQKKYKDVKVFGCFVNYKIVEILLKDKYITKDDISHCITTKKYYEPKSFKEFVKITAELEVQEFKKINNILNGVLKDSFTRKTKTYFTTDVNSLCYIYNNAVSQDIDIKWNYDEKTGYHFIKTIKKHKRLTNTSSFYRTTLSCSILQTLKLIKKCSKYGKIKKVLTDAVYYEPFDTNKIVQCPEITQNEIICNLGKYSYELCDRELEKHRTKDIIFEEIPIVKNSVYITGAGGLGKTYTTIQKFKDELKNNNDTKLVLTSFLNDATSNIQDKVSEIVGSRPSGWTITTLTRLFQSFKNGFYNNGGNLFKYDCVIVDECITMPIRFLRRLEQSNIKKIYLGDEHQLHQVFSKYDQETNISNYFRKYCDVIEKKYEGPDKSRYDEETYELLEDFKNTGFVKKIIKKVSKIDKDKVYKNNIAFSNKKCLEINKRCCDHFHKDNDEFVFCVQKDSYIDEDGNEYTPKQNKFKTKFKIGKDTPLRCETNNKEITEEYGINVGWRGRIVDINDTHVILEGVILYDKKFIKSDKIYISTVILSQHFSVAYAMTCHKWQGQTIHGPFAVHETNNKKFWGISRNYMYTAFSRTGNLKNIHIDKKDTSKYFRKWEPNKQIINAEKMKTEIDIYKVGNCYKSILSVDDDLNTKVYKTMIGTKAQISNRLKVLNYNTINKIIIEKPVQIQSFKPLIKQTNRKTIINVYKNRIKCTYYDEKEDKKKMKDLKPNKKRDLQETFNQAIKLYPDAEINDKNKLIISFC